MEGVNHSLAVGVWEVSEFEALKEKDDRLVPRPVLDGTELTRWAGGSAVWYRLAPKDQEADSPPFCFPHTKDNEVAFTQLSKYPVGALVAARLYLPDHQDRTNKKINQLALVRLTVGVGIGCGEAGTPGRPRKWSLIKSARVDLK